MKRLSALPVEAGMAALLGVVALVVDSPWRWLALAGAIAFALLLLRNDTGIRLFAAAVATSPFAAAIYWEGLGSWRLALVGLGVVLIWAARWFGAVVWPDVAVFFLVGLAVVAVRDAREETPKPQPPPPAVAVVDLPASRIQPPTGELESLSEVEIVALTPAGEGEAGHEAMRVEALLLTPITRSGARAPVRVLVERGKDGATVTQLARATVDGTFVLLPASECFVAAPRLDLSHRRVATILEGNGIPAATAKAYADSFEGPVDFVPLSPGTRLNRYFSGASTVGNFLTDTEFESPEKARDGLELPERNRATSVQTVSVVAPAMTLRGRIRGGLQRALQFLVLRTACYEYGPPRAVEARAP